MFDVFSTHVQLGNSWILFAVVLVVSLVVCYFATFRDSQFREWFYEPIISVPKHLQKDPFVVEWFQTTRGPYYGTKHKRSFQWQDYFTKPLPKMKTNTLFSGWALAHFVEHFFLAFLCPKFAPISLLLGVGWEVAESVMNEHCLLDIFWNLCGCIAGLFMRKMLLPE